MTTKTKIGYKVVRYKQQNMVSVNSNLNYDALVTYEVNNWTYPRLKHTDLYVFDNILDAAQFLQKMREDDTRQFALFEVEYIPSRRKPLLFSGLFVNRKLVELEEIRKQKIKTPIHIMNMISIPKATMCAKAVKLVSLLNY